MGVDCHDARTELCDGSYGSLTFRLLELTLHPLQGLIHLFEHLLRGDPKLPKLRPQLFDRELGLEVFRELKAFHKNAITLHQVFHRVDELLLPFSVELSVIRPQLHQLLIVAKKMLGLLLHDFGIEEGHGLEKQSISF